MSRSPHHERPRPDELRERHEDVLRNFEDAWRGGRTPILEEYLPKDPRERSELLVELVHLDLEYRIKAGEAVTLATYTDRFPELNRNRAILEDLRAAAEAMRRQANLTGAVLPPAPPQLLPFGNITSVAPTSESYSQDAPAPVTDTSERRELFTLWREEILEPLRGRLRTYRALTASLAALLMTVVVCLWFLVMERGQRQRKLAGHQEQHYSARLAAARAQIQARGPTWRRLALENIRLATELAGPERDLAALRDLAAECLSSEYPCFEDRPLKIKHSSPVTAVALAHTGTADVIGHADGTIRWNSAPGGSTRVDMIGHQGRITGLEFLPDGQRFVSVAADGMICFWDTKRLPEASSAADSASDKPLRKVDLDSGAVLTCDLALDGKLLALGCEDGSVFLLSLTTDETPRLLCREAGPITCVAFRPGHAVLAIGAPGQPLRFRDTVTGVELHTQNFGDAISGVAFSADGMSLVVTDQELLGFYTAAAAPEAVAVRHNHLHAGPVTHVRRVDRLPRDQRAFWLTASRDGSVKLWSHFDPTTIREMAVARGTDGSPALAIAARPDGSAVLAGNQDGTASMLALAAPTCRAIVLGGCSEVAFSGRKLINPGYVYDFSQGMDATVQNFPAFGGELGHRGGITGVAVTPDGERFVTSSADRTLKVWNARTVKLVGTIPMQRGAIRAVAFSSDGKYLATAADEVTLHEALSLRELHHLAVNSAPAASLVFHPAKPWLIAVRADLTTQTWEVPSCAQVKDALPVPSTVNVLAFSPDGRLLATASGDSITLWDTETHTRLVTLRGIDGQVRSLAFSGDGAMLAAGYLGRPTMVWDLPQLRKTLAELGLDW